MHKNIKLPKKHKNMFLNFYKEHKKHFIHLWYKQHLPTSNVAYWSMQSEPRFMRAIGFPVVKKRLALRILLH